MHGLFFFELKRSFLSTGHPQISLGDEVHHVLFFFLEKEKEKEIKETKKRGQVQITINKRYFEISDPMVSAAKVPSL